MDAAPDRLLRYGERRLLLLKSDDRVALLAGADERAVIDPLLLEKFDRGHPFGADEQENGAAGHGIIGFGERIRIVWWSVGRAPPDQAMEVHVGQAGELRVPRVHAPDVA